MELLSFQYYVSRYRMGYNDHRVLSQLLLQRHSHLGLLLLLRFHDVTPAMGQL